MVYRDNKYILSIGKRVYAEGGLFGLSADGKLCAASSQPRETYAFTFGEAAEVASFMIERRRQFAQRHAS